MGIVKSINQSILVGALSFILINTITANAVFATELNSQTMNDYLFESQMKELVQNVNHMILSDEVKYNLSIQPVNDSCKELMTDEYEFGKLGKTVFSTLDKNSTAMYRLIDGGELNNLCQGYKDKTLEDKARVWTMVLTLMSHFESSCNPNVPAKGPNGKLYGLFQLHKHQEAFYDGKSELCSKNASLNPQKSVTCTLSMLNMQYEKQSEKLFAPGSYWDVLRLKSKTKKAILIKKAIVKSSLCNGSSL